jgi:PQQ-dependent dehydrogenase (methanol/ethanol family)
MKSPIPQKSPILIASLLFAIVALPANAQSPAGKQSFVSHCAACHGEDGHGGQLGPNIIDVANPRATSAQAVHNLIRSGIPSAGMPAFTTLSDAEVDSIGSYVMSLKASANAAAGANANSAVHQAPSPGDVTAGFQFFSTQGNCLSCHAIRGRGGVIGPDLGSIATKRTAQQIEQALRNPGSLPQPQARGRRWDGGDEQLNGTDFRATYSPATITLSDGKTIRGVLQHETNFDLQLMGLDAHLYLLSKDQVTNIAHDSQSVMPKTAASADQIQNLLAYLTRLIGDSTDKSLPLPPLDLGKGIDFSRITHPNEGDWPSYNGDIRGNRFSPLSEINTANIAQLAPRWSWTMPGTRRALEDTPQVIDGIMYVTGSNECFALDARTGRQIWHYARPRTKDLVPTGDAVSGINRGVAILGDRVFMITDNAHLIALHRYTGQLVWDTEMADSHQNYGATQAPLAVGDLIISGISGGDEGVRGFLSAYKASTGERVWRFWTVPAPGEPGSETWVGTSINHPGSSTWMTGTYDPESDILYWGVGNPGPDFNGDQRKGDNLYSCSILALNPKTGKLLWYHQMTPHNTNDWDATQTPMLVDADFHGQPRKLLLQANRNGFFYVLDRLTGDFLTGAPFIHNITWASGLDPKTGRPIIKEDPAPTTEGKRVCPEGAGATNWPSASFYPPTAQFFVFATEDCHVFVKNEEPFALGKSFYQGSERQSPGDPTKKFIRALDIQTGQIAWEIANIGGGPLDSGLMTTAGGFIFYGDANGAVIAADAKSGKILWHYETGQQFKGSPMSYSIDNKQRLILIAGQTILSFGLR